MLNFFIIKFFVFQDGVMIFVITSKCTSWTIFIGKICYLGLFASSLKKVINYEKSFFQVQNFPPEVESYLIRNKSQLAAILENRNTNNAEIYHLLRLISSKTFIKISSHFQWKISYKYLGTSYACLWRLKQSNYFHIPQQVAICYILRLFLF